jgi:hypothetical protein
MISGLPTSIPGAMRVVCQSLLKSIDFDPSPARA